MPTQPLFIKKLSELPSQLEPSTLYITPDTGDPTNLIFTATNQDGTVSKGTYTWQDIVDIVKAEVSPIRTRVRTFDLPNIGDSCDVDLDGIIRINYVKTTNSGYEGYQVHLYAIGPDRTVGFRRDTIYDNTALEGYNNNNLVLSETTGFLSDSLAYGSMREFTRKVIIDYTTMVSWQIDIYGFGNGKLRFIVARYQESD